MVCIPNSNEKKKTIKRLKAKGKTTIKSDLNQSFKLKEKFNINRENIDDNNILNKTNKITINPKNFKKGKILVLSSNYINNSIKNQEKTKKYEKNLAKRFKSFNKRFSFDYQDLSNYSIKSEKQTNEKNIENPLFINVKNDLDVNIEEYLSTDIDDMDYDDAIKKDNREFCTYFKERLKASQIILNTFCYYEPLKPRPIKILLFILQIDLYLFVNGLFFNEEYVSQVFHLKNETFYDYFQRFIRNFFYAALVSVIVGYIIECFFIDEKKIKGILKREKDNLLILKYEIVQITKDIKKRYLCFILISFVITIFTWYYISCFNNVYPHMKKEWIVFSVLIIISMQILSILVCLLETILRFISFRCKSEKIYKLSLLLA